MPTTFPSTPYFDDYDEDKQFYRILFRPGRAVQARELTQLQTLSQAQIERMGNNVFKNGTIISDCAFSLDLKIKYLKINDQDASAADVDITDIENGFTLEGVTSGVTGYVVTVLDGVQTATNTKTIFFKYTAGNGTVKSFQDGEQVTVKNAAGNTVLTVVALSSNSTGTGSAFTLGDGIIYANGVFLKHLSQTLILDRYSIRPTYKVGITLTETVVGSNTDESLLDPALGSSNYFASGADRYKITTVLTKKEINEEDLTGFFLLFEIEDGQQKRAFEKTEYNVIQDEIANRTFEESGDYTVRPFKPRIREHLKTNTNGGLYTANTSITGNASLLAVGIEPGLGYVRGYRVSSLITEYLSIEKGNEFASEEQQPVALGYGNYVLVKETAGPWDVDNGTVISLRSANALAVTNSTYGSTAAPGSQIGTARVKSVVYETGNIGTADGQYRVYLYDISMSDDFSNVRSIYYNAGSGPDSLADVVLTSSGAAQLQESNFNRGVFKFPQRAIKTLRDTLGSIDNSFEFKKSFDVTIGTGGTFSVNSPVANEELPYAAGALNATQKRTGFVLVTLEAGTTANLTGTVNTTTSSNLVQGLGTSFTTELKAGDNILIGYTGGDTYKIANIVSDTQLYVVNAVGTSNLTTNVIQKVFESGEYIDLSETGSAGSERAVTVVSDTVANVDIKETLTSTIEARVLVNLQKTDGQEIAKTLRKDRYVKIDCSSAGTAGTYSLGFSDIYRVSAIYHGTDYSISNTDVTNQFTIDNGQRDTLYTHGRIILKAGSSLSLTSASRLLIKLDYFFHDTSSGVGFYSIDSYPVDDTETDPNSIRTENIPVFTSPTSGELFDLRDCIDIRPRYADTASDATSVGSASINPSSPSSFSVPSGGLRVPVPNEEFRTDLDYYLARRDVVYIDSEGAFGVTTGLSEIDPARPVYPADVLPIATINVPPYPSLSYQLAKLSGRFDYQVTMVLFDTKRYTMSDIGAINQRINRLEYYAALNFLEGDAKNQVIVSDVTGLDRFKNGFLVDNFAGHGIGDVNDVNYSCSIDPVQGELRPLFNIDNLDVEFNSSDSSSVYRAPKDAVITLSSVTGTFYNGNILTQGGISGNVDYVVGNRLYVSNILGGTFTTGSVAAGSASATASNVIIPTDGDLVTLPYVHDLYASNPFATKPRNCVGELLFQWVGELELNPPADNWTDTRTNPDLVVNFDNGLDNWLALDQAWGTQWNDWETSWTGTPSVASATIEGQGTGLVTDTTIATVTTNVGQARTGTNLTVRPQTINYDLGTRVIDVNIIPFIRSQIVTFTASRLKPNTRVYPFFDTESVSAHCRPIGGNYGDALTTNSNGVVTGQFRIPNNNQLRFRVGSRLFRLSDDELDRQGFITTSATSTFTAFGLNQTQETTILSSRGAQVGFTTESDSRVIQTQSVNISQSTRFVEPPPPPPEPDFTWDGGGDGGDGGGDPISQTFFVENTDNNGLFLTKIEVFFRTKSSTRPITLQVREVVNGVPGSRIIPFGTKTLYPDEINVSEDASAPTIFQFPSPVYLKDKIEYCFVLLPAGNNPEYNIWVSELGENQLGTTNRVSEQPYAGLLFVSANNRTWTPIQSEDLKFNIYRAKFDTSQTGQLVLNNDDADYIYLTNQANGTLQAGDPVRYAAGTGTVMEYDSINDVVKVLKDSTDVIIRARINATGTANANTYSNVVIGTSTLFNTEAYANAVIYDANTNTRIGKIINIVSDTEAYLDALATENVTSNAFILYDELVNTDNTSIYATVETRNDKLISLFKTNYSLLEFVPTTITGEFKIRDSSANTVSTYRSFNINENYYLDSEAKVSSDSTEFVNHSNVKSYATKLTMSTTSPFVSPALDLFKTSAIVVHNQINNDSTGETTNQGNALSRYISKVVTLDEGQDAEDLRVYLTAHKPPITDVKVYARISNVTDDTPFNELDYIEMEQVTSTIVQSSSKLKTDYREYEYKLPSSVLTGPNGEVQYTIDGTTFTGYKRFAIKIVLLSSDTSIVPKVKDYRAIALQL